MVFGQTQGGKTMVKPTLCNTANLQVSTPGGGGGWQESFEGLIRDSVVGLRDFFAIRLYSGRMFWSPVP